jgi:hypothetical protein
MASFLPEQACHLSGQESAWQMRWFSAFSSKSEIYQCEIVDHSCMCNLHPALWFRDCIQRKERKCRTARDFVGREDFLEDNRITSHTGSTVLRNPLFESCVGSLSPHGLSRYFLLSLDFHSPPRQSRCGRIVDAAWQRDSGQGCAFLQSSLVRARLEAARTAIMVWFHSFLHHNRL